MILGLDLDNTIISYDGLFHMRGVELGCVPEDLATDKNSVSSYLKERDQNDLWTNMQAEIYGPLLNRARPYAGALEFVREALGRDVALHIISHKTRTAAADPAIDLRAFATEWLEQYGFLSGASTELIFAETREEKVAHIREVACTHFVDDLVEVFEEPGFPSGTHQVLFDPHRRSPDWSSGTRVESWEELSKELFA